MKLQNATYIDSVKLNEYFKDLKITISLFHCCSSIIIRKDDVDYILKDRWRDPYISNERNIESLACKEFHIISKPLLTRIIKHMKIEDIFFVGDNLIIEM